MVSVRTFAKLYAYKIMFHLGLMDVIQLITYYLVVAFMGIANSHFSYSFSKVNSDFGIIILFRFLLPYHVERLLVPLHLLYFSL